LPTQIFTSVVTTRGELVFPGFTLKFLLGSTGVKQNAGEQKLNSARGWGDWT